MHKDYGISFGTLKKQRLSSQKAQNEVFIQINECLSDLYSYDQIMTEWLEQSEENKRQFFSDPIGTFKMVASPNPNTLQLLEATQKIDESQKSLFYDSFLCREDFQDGDILSAPTPLSDNQWNLIASIRVDEVNKIIKWAFSKKVLPNPITYSTMITILGMEVELKIEFQLDVPKIIGGTGTQIEVCFPIKKGVLSTDYGKWDLMNNVIVYLTVDLKCVETESGNKTYKFYMVFSEGFIKHVRLEGLPENVQKDFGLILDDIITNALLEATKDLEILICKLSPESVKGFEFLIPTYANYILTPLANFGDSPLSILACTVSKHENQPYAVKPDIIPKSSEASVALSDELFMRYVLLPMLNAQFDISGKKPIFDVRQDVGKKYLTVFNTRSFNLKKQNGYTPKVKKFTVSEYDGRLHIDINVTVSPSKGINLNYTSKGTYTMEFEQLKNGGQKLVLKKDTYESSHKTHIDDWVWVVAAFAGIAAAFLALVGPLAIGISESIVAIIAAIVDTKAPNGIDPGVITSAVDTVKWGHTDLLAFTGATVNDDGICLGMNINFTDKL